MFERRLKIIVGLLFAMSIVMLGRAGQLQIFGRHHWVAEAEQALRSTEFMETSRGAIYDCNGVPLALDVACIDACVDYRAVLDPPDPAWVRSIAAQWAKSHRTDELRGADNARKKAIIEEERLHVLDRIHAMWDTLAVLGKKSPEEIAEIRQSIINRVEARRQSVWFRKYQLAKDAYEAERAEQAEKESGSWWKRWFADDGSDAPRLNDFDMNLGEQTAPHQVLNAISTEVQNRLGKSIETFPGLSLRPGMTRSYPRGEAVCHITGRLSHVNGDDLKRDPFRKDDLKRYQVNDLVGRGGLEGLCEPILRGQRGRILKTSSEEAGTDERVLDRDEAKVGRDVKSTIDVDLQEQVVRLFQKADVDFGDELHTKRKVSVHGGAVLIDVETGAVRVLASNPGFDPNTLDDMYKSLAADDLNKPLLNRATQYPLETGSTIKPVVGLGAITQHAIGVNDGIECTGYLKIGNRTYRTYYRCWVASKFARTLGDMAIRHHGVPTEAPHRGHDGNADGFLTFSDALERSCNVYFETVANRLGLEGLSYWMDQFGLGRPTGLGIDEWSGRLPDSYEGPDPKGATWLSGIGQGPVAATPIQMANVAATIARNGIWVRPSLVSSEMSEELRAVDRGANDPTTASATAARTPPSRAWYTMKDRVDLHLDRDGLKAAQEGMYRVVNSYPSGTGHPLHSDDFDIAGKTGTAQAAPYRPIVVDENAQPKRDEHGKIVREPLTPSTAAEENPVAPWYTAFDNDGKNLKHSWMIGYAPADHPQVAFAVMVEYGGSGGGAAASIAKGMLEAASARGYVARKMKGNLAVNR